jgi:hypothetical protein
MRKQVLSVCTAVGVLLSVTTILANFDGAIWTTTATGEEVNFNIYDSKEDVYLNGGPGHGSGSNSNGLPDGTYVFMVTDPSGATLLSTDAAECRQVSVVDGVFAGAVDPPTCGHENGSADVGTPVQLMPYNDTPNNGGEYKVWLTPLGAYQCRQDMSIVACTEGQTFGFVHADSKTDNFKVGDEVPDEIDTRFHDTYFGGGLLDGFGINWQDTHGASNKKYSYFAPEHFVNHEAHVEAPEIGTHYISIANQPGCTVGDVYVAGTKQRKKGPQTVGVKVTKGMKNKGTFTVFVDVVCQ